MEKTKAGQPLGTAAQGKHLGRPKGLDADILGQVKSTGKGLSVAETVELTGISLSGVERYPK